MKTQYNEIHDTLVAMSVAISNNYFGFESNMAQHKLEEARLWLAQSSKMQPVQSTPKINSNQSEPASVPEESDKPTRPRVEKVILMDNPQCVGLVVEEPEVQTPRLPSKEELIFMAKEFGKTHGADNFVLLLGTFNAKNISELYAQGDDVVLKFVSAISN